jgi:hypothetical protein
MPDTTGSQFCYLLRLTTQTKETTKIFFSFLVNVLKIAFIMNYCLTFQ